MTDKPTALRLADECDEGMVDFAEVATELRRLHAINGELMRELNAVASYARGALAAIAKLESQI